MTGAGAGGGGGGGGGVVVVVVVTFCDEESTVEGTIDLAAMKFTGSVLGQGGGAGAAPVVGGSFVLKPTKA